MTAVVAHRGSPDRAAGIPENTLAAFLRARDLGADGVELDARLTADGAVCVHHDPELPGLGPVSGLRTADLPEEVPLLPAVLEATDGLWVNIEIKNLPGEPGFDPGEGLARAVVDFLPASGPRPEIVVSSFWPPALTAARDADPDLPTGLLYARALSPAAAVAAALERGCTAIHPAADLVTDELVLAAHEAGLSVCTWTVNDPGRIAAFGALGVDAVITDDVPTARAVLGGARP